MEITIIPSREMFYSSETCFGIYACDVHANDKGKVSLNRYGNISVKGNMPKLTTGTEYIASLEEYKDEKYGNGYLLLNIRQELPTDVDEQKEYIRQLVTPNQFDAIYEVYEGQDVLQLMRDDLFDFSRIKGLGETTYKNIKNKLLGNEGLQELLAWLGKFGVRYNTVAKIVDSFDSPQIAKQMIEENPYLLAKHVSGIGFIKADEIAIKMGLAKDSPRRIKACIVHAIKEENGNGNAYIFEKELIERCGTYLELSHDKILEQLYGEFREVKIIEDKITLKQIYEAEQFIAQRLVEINEFRYDLDIHVEEDGEVEIKEKEPFDVKGFLERYCKANEVVLTEEQESFFYKFMEHNVLFLVANAGSGKSFLQKILVAMLREMGLTFGLYAPTGKASKVLSNYVGYPASTLHRALGLFNTDEDVYATIDKDVLLVDEVSMLDIFLAKNLARAISLGSKVVFIGDDFQLPSVQVGNFLYDCINSNTLPVVRLTKVFRQQEGGVIDIATKIRKGEKFLDSMETGKKTFGKDMIIHLTDQDYMEDGYKHYYKTLLKKFDKDDIIILSPTKKGKLGTVAINKAIQEIVNPKRSGVLEYTYGETIFRVGDLVMNTANAYEMNTVDNIPVDILANGEMGKVSDIDLKNKKVIIDFSDIGEIPIPIDYLKNIIHSYCTTIHKMQGSSFPVVLMVTDKAHKFQLNANLLYTGITRTQKYALMLSQAETINHGIKKFANMTRRSFLGGMLAELKVNKDVAQEELA